MDIQIGARRNCPKLEKYFSKISKFSSDFNMAKEDANKEMEHYPIPKI